MSTQTVYRAAIGTIFFSAFAGLMNAIITLYGSGGEAKSGYASFNSIFFAFPRFALVHGRQRDGLKNAVPQFFIHLKYPFVSLKERSRSRGTLACPVPVAWAA